MTRNNLLPRYIASFYFIGDTVEYDTAFTRVFSEGFILKAKASTRRSSTPRATRTGANPSASQTGRPGDRSFMLALLAFLVLRLLAVYLAQTETRVWGIDFARFIGEDVWTHVLLIFPLVFFIPRYGKRVAASIIRLSDAVGRVLPFPAVAMVLAAAVLVCAASFAQYYPFLGDGVYYRSEIYRVMNDADYSAGFIKPTALLTAMLLQFLARHLPAEALVAPYSIVGMLGLAMLIGGLFVFLRKQRLQLLVFGAVFLLVPAALMYFSYVELYVLEYSSAALFLVTAWLCVRGRLNAAVPGGFLVLALLFGASAAVFVPSYVFVLYRAIHWRGRRLPDRFIVPAYVAAHGIFLVLYYALYGLHEHSFYLAPLLPMHVHMDGISFGMLGYCVASLPRTLDLLNIVVLNSGPLCFVVVPLYVLRSRLASTTPEVRFALLAAFSSAVMLLFGYAGFGWGRDWDLATIPVLGLSFASAALLLEAFEARRVSSLVLPALLATLATHCVLWLSLNFQKQSADFLHAQVRTCSASILAQDTWYGYEILKQFHDNHEADPEAALAMTRPMIEIGLQTPRLYQKYMEDVYRLRDASSRAGHLEWLFAHMLTRAKSREIPPSGVRLPAHQLYEEISEALFRSYTVDSALTMRWAGQFHVALPDWKQYSFITAVFNDTIALADKWTYAAASVGDSTTNDYLAALAGDLYREAGKSAESVRYYRRALALEPHEYPHLYLRLAAVQLQTLHDTLAATTTLRQCISNCAMHPDVHEARERLHALSLNTAR